MHFGLYLASGARQHVTLESPLHGQASFFDSPGNHAVLADATGDRNAASSLLESTAQTLHIISCSGLE